MRKEFLFLYSALMCLAISSCTQMSQGHFTPEIHCGYLLHNPIYALDTLFCDDTLTVRYSSDMGCYVTNDTINVGDSVLMATSFYSVANNLISASATWDSTAMAIRFDLDQAINDALDLSKTDIPNGYLALKSGYNYLSFPIIMTMKKPGVSKVSLKVESDSKFSPTGITIAYPVR